MIISALRGNRGWLDSRGSGEIQPSRVPCDSRDASKAVSNARALLDFAPHQRGQFPPEEVSPSLFRRVSCLASGRAPQLETAASTSNKRNTGGRIARVYRFDLTRGPRSIPSNQPPSTPTTHNPTQSTTNANCHY